MDAGAGKRPRAAPEAPDPRLSLLFRVTELLSVEQLPLEGLLDAVAALACEEVAELCGIALLSDSGHLLHPIGLRHRNEQINEQLDSWPRLAWGTAVMRW